MILKTVGGKHWIRRAKHREKWKIVVNFPYLPCHTSNHLLCITNIVKLLHCIFVIFLQFISHINLKQIRFKSHHVVTHPVLRYIFWFSQQSIRFSTRNLGSAISSAFRRKEIYYSTEGILALFECFSARWSAYILIFTRVVFLFCQITFPEVFSDCFSTSKADVTIL